MSRRSYSTNDPKGWCGDPRRGAALGRPAIHEGRPEGVVIVRRSRLDRQGYDRNGTYFGDGDPLYWYADGGGKIDAMIRAEDDGSAPVRVRQELAKRGIHDVPIRLGRPLSLPCFGAGEAQCPDKANATSEGEAGLGGDLCEACLIRESEEQDDARG